MKLRALPKGLKLRNKRVLVRVDWNVPLHVDATTEKAEKIARTLPLLRELIKRGAVIFILTHLGRPKGRDPAYSTRPLARTVSAYADFPVSYLDVDLSNAAGIKAFHARAGACKSGHAVLLENVRFQSGEEKNDAKIVKAYAACAHIFINEAFASSHRSHATVAGLAKALPSYAGPSLIKEVNAVSRVLTRAKHPFYVFIGGSKLSGKITVIERLLKIADKVFIAGAMAHPFFTARRIKIGKSYMESGSVRMARKLIKNRKIVLPTDAIVARKIERGAGARRAAITDVKASEMIGDIGTETMRAWADEVKRAQTILWNGPFGVTEIPAFSHGSMVMAKAIALRAKGRAFALIGGGDTLAVMAKTGMQDMVDFVSTGGGAMLEFIANKGNLPGLKPLQAKDTRNKDTRNK
jgi:phosphoglycerate kinase